MKYFNSIPLILFLWVSLIHHTAYAQDPRFSQVYANPVYLNPATSAISGKARASLNYRLNYLNSETKFKTFCSSLEIPIQKRNALAFQFFSDQQGDGQIATHTVSAAYVYRFLISRKWEISSSLQMLAGQHSINTQNLVFEDQLRNGKIVSSSREKINSQAQNFVNFSSSLFIRGEKIYAGAAIHHLDNSAQDHKDFLFQSARKLILHGGVRIQTSDRKGNSYISPNVIYHQQGKFNSLSIGQYLSHRGFTTGLWYRWNQAVVLLVGLEWDQFRMAYSIDLQLDQRSGSNAHEISLAYSWGRNRITKSYHRKELAACPLF